MDRLLFGAFFLLLGALAESEDRPNFTVLEKYEDYEARQFPDTAWITTKVPDKSVDEITKANDRLDDYCKKIEDNSDWTCSSNWPTLVTVMNDSEYYMSWFLFPGSDESISVSDPDVTVKHIPGGEVYVRPFGGTPSIESGEENAETLQEALEADGKTFNSNVYYGASYSPFWSITHHNEIWIFKD